MLEVLTKLKRDEGLTLRSCSAFMNYVLKSEQHVNLAHMLAQVGNMLAHKFNGDILVIWKMYCVCTVDHSR